jgi:serine/threonine-protein kinase
VGEDAGLPGLGVAHGWAGRLYAALRWCRAAGEAPPAGLAARLAELAALAEPWGRGLRWPCIGEDGSHLGSLAGWCKGSAGFYFLWDEALRHFPEEGGPGFARLREGAAWHAWEGPDEGPDLCCGVAGRSYALLSLFRRTGEAAWRARAEALAERAARGALRPERAADAPDALLKGALGVAVLGADLESPEAAAFPCFEEAR